MSDQVLPPLPQAALLQAELLEVAQALCQGRGLDSAAQNTLAELLEEMSEAINSSPPSTELLHVAQTASQVAKTLHSQAPRVGLETGREQLRHTMAWGGSAQLSALAGRFLDALANIGI